RARHHVGRGRDPPRPGLPRLWRQPDDHRVHRLRRVLQHLCGLPGKRRSSRPRGRLVPAVRIPPTLRGEIGGARQLEAEGDTVRELLENLTSRYPALAQHVWADGDVAPFLNVYVGGEDVRTLDGLDTQVNGSPVI